MDTRASQDGDVPPTVQRMLEQDATLARQFPIPQISSSLSNDNRSSTHPTEGLIFPVIGDQQSPGALKPPNVPSLLIPHSAPIPHHAMVPYEKALSDDGYSSERSDPPSLISTQDLIAQMSVMNIQSSPPSQYALSPTPSFLPYPSQNLIPVPELDPSSSETPDATGKTPRTVSQFSQTKSSPWIPTAVPLNSSPPIFETRSRQFWE